MAQTEKGIIYPFDYNEVADVPSDFKALAESIDRILSDYSLNTESGNKIVLEMNSTTYKIKAILKDKDNSVISTSNEIDLPLENMVTNISYNDQTLILTHQDGQTTEVSIADLISDLASKEEVEELQSQVDDLTTLVETELDSNTVEGTEIDVSDSAEYRGPVMPGANLEQEQLSGKNVWRFSNLNFLTDVAGSHNIIDENILEVTSSNNTYSNSKFRLDLPDGTYTFKLGKVTNSNANMSTKRMTLSKFINNSRTAIHHIDEGDSYTFTISNNEDEYYVLEFWASYATALVNTARFEKIQVELGSTETDFEPYCGGQASPNPDYPQEMQVVTGDNVVRHVGKNLFDKNNANKLNGGYIDIYSNKIVTSNNARCIYIPIKENCSYTVSKKITNYSHFRIATTQDIPTIGSTVSDLQAGDGNTTSLTLTSSLKSRYLVVWWGRVDYDNEDEVLSSIQLEEGTTPTPYEPHREEEYELSLGNIELCKIGEYQDYIYKENGNWYKYNAIGKVVLDGSEGWSGASATDKKRFVCNAALDTIIPENQASIGSLLSDKFIAVTANNTSSKVQGIAIAGSGKFVVYCDATKDYSTGALFSEWVASNNITVYYALATPTTTQITDTTLISQLEALRKAKWFKGTNHWWTETENLEPNLKGTYKQSNNLKNKAKNDEQDERLTNLESRLALLE